ncbi:MAG: hypothetical protein R2822_30760 [Spirosomataceae bacterium]
MRLCAGNYGGSLYPAKLAQQQGYDQIIWTDARDHAFVRIRNNERDVCHGWKTHHARYFLTLFWMA